MKLHAIGHDPVIVGRIGPYYRYFSDFPRVGKEAMVLPLLLGRARIAVADLGGDEIESFW